MAIEQAGGVVIRRAGNEVRYLLVTAKQDRRRWIWPKGHIEEGESAEQAAIREVREEAGVVGRVRETLGAVTYRVGGEDRRVQFFLMEFVRSVDAEDDRKVAWWSFDDAMTRLGVVEAQEILSRARRASAKS